MIITASYGVGMSKRQSIEQDENSTTSGEYQSGNPADDDEFIQEHADISSYDGPQTCISCHEEEAYDALNSVHMQWNGPTPQLSNTDGEDLGKANRGINTFCTYAMSSRNTCFSCHVRADGNAGHDPVLTDVDCLMCHSDVYQRKLVLDPNDTVTVTNVLGLEQTYLFGMVDDDGNYITEPDFNLMPDGITMVDVARTVHKPTRYTCLRCHAAAGGGDWTKRGDMGWSSVDPNIHEDIHLSPHGADLHCVNCHAAAGHKIGGRGIDLRQTEAEVPTCKACHSSRPHSKSDLNRHAAGQVSCQVCHIREYAKGGKTEISRDWLIPHWNPAFCYGQGGFVGEEVKERYVQPEYVWFDGTSYVYNVGEYINPGENGLYHMAFANGAAFDGESSIVPIKRHFTNIPLHESGKIVPPVIMWMFMTGYFDQAVIEGMRVTDGMEATDSYTMVDADAEMLITHGVDTKDRAPRCTECHDNTGHTPDGDGILPFTKLGYHELPAAVLSCTLCHERERMISFQSMHRQHREDVTCTSCHISEPTGFIKDLAKLCSSCHDSESWEEDSHEEHLEKEITCSECHSF
jgi:hypothetical protein